VLAGEAFLARIYNAYRTSRAETGSNVFNTALFIGFDEPGGTYDHVAPGAVLPPDPLAPEGELGFQFDRSGYRVPAVLVSPWIGSNVVVTEEYRHTSLLSTLREVWGLGDPFSQRDAAARTFQHLFTLDEPRDPDSWPNPLAKPVPRFQLEHVDAGEAIGTLGKHVAQGLLERGPFSRLVRRLLPTGEHGEVSPQLALAIVHLVAEHYFPRLAHRKWGRLRAVRTIIEELARGFRHRT
jgi:phospholipase C